MAPQMLGTRCWLDLQTPTKLHHESWFLKNKYPKNTTFLKLSTLAKNCVSKSPCIPIFVFHTPVKVGVRDIGWCHQYISPREWTSYLTEVHTFGIWVSPFTCPEGKNSHWTWKKWQWRCFSSSKGNIYIYIYIYT